MPRRRPSHSVTSPNSPTGCISALLAWPRSRRTWPSRPAPDVVRLFRQAVLHAFLHQRQGTNLWADVTTKGGDAVSGTVSRVEQAFVAGSTNAYTLETSIVLDTDEGEVSFGGPGAFIEDYETDTVMLRTA